MSVVLISSLKLYASYGFTNTFIQTITQGYAKHRLYNTLWSTGTKSRGKNDIKSVVLWKKCSNWPKQCTTRSVADLFAYFDEKIAQEWIVPKYNIVPSEIDDFEVELDGSEVNLVKYIPNGTIKVNFCIEKMRDTNDHNFINCFTVAVEKRNKRLELRCYCNDLPIIRGKTGYNFFIYSMILYKNEKEWKSRSKSIVGEIGYDFMEDHLHELLIIFLKKQGVSAELLSKLSKFSTAFKSSRVSFLGEMKDFFVNFD